MAIIQTIDNASQFRDQFHKAGRGEQFSYEGLGLLFDYLDDMDMDVELDVIGICCDFAEDTVENIADYYSINLEDCEGDYYEISDRVKNFLENQGVFIGETSKGFVYKQF